MAAEDVITALSFIAIAWTSISIGLASSLRNTERRHPTPSGRTSVNARRRYRFAEQTHRKDRSSQPPGDSDRETINDRWAFDACAEQSGAPNHLI